MVRADLRASLGRVIVLVASMGVALLGAVPAVQAAPVDDPAIPRGASAGDEIPGRYVVVLHEGEDPQEVADEHRRDGAKVRHVYGEAVNGFAAELSPGRLQALQRDPRVAEVRPDVVASAGATQLDPPSWGLDRVDQRALPLDSSYGYSHTGAGVRAYIVDSGIRASHTEFGGRVVAGYSAYAGGSTTDCNGHGTHVAGTVGGQTAGVAKGVTLVAVRVFGCDSSGAWSDIIAGINWIIDNHPAGTPGVVNMSLGSTAYEPGDTAVRNGVSAGLTFAVSAGNKNADACNYTPARVAEAITVGATTSSDSRASYSNWGSCLQLFAPGSGIRSAGHTSDTDFANMSGTSMAAPHVVGIAALYLERDPSLSPAQVGSLITSAATSGTVGSPGSGSPNKLAFSAQEYAAVTAPAGVTVEADDGAAPVSWQPNPQDQSVIRYRVHTTPAGGETRTTTVEADAGCAATCATTLPGLDNGVAHTVTVTAVNVNEEGPHSAPVEFTPLPLPAAPAGLSATAGYHQVRVGWDQSPAGQFTTGYTLYYAAEGTREQAVPVGTDACDGTRCEHVVAELVNGATYRFTVTSTNSRGESPRADEVTAVPQRPLGTPSFVSAVGLDKSAVVSWLPGDGAESAESYTIRAYAFDGTLAATTEVSGLEFTLPRTSATIELPSGGLYTFTVQANSADGGSDESAPSFHTAVLGLV